MCSCLTAWAACSMCSCVCHSLAAKDTCVRMPLFSGTADLRPSCEVTHRCSVEEGAKCFTRALADLVFDGLCFSYRKLGGMLDMTL